MKQKLLIFFSLILLVVVLAGLNAATYVQKETIPDSEADPNRSTYNSGATGTQAFYTLLAETGRKVTRWQEPPSALLTAKVRPAVFVVVGRLRREFNDTETESLLRWVSQGGRLVVIDREPPKDLVTTTGAWNVVLIQPSVDVFAADPSDRKQMIGDSVAVKPVQPTLYTQGVNAVQPSKFKAAIGFSRLEGPTAKGHGTPTRENTDEEPSAGGYDVPPPSDAAPIVHFASREENLIVETVFGEGRIVFVADPYIVSNNGIALADNSHAAINLVAASDRVIAFDEYHQGHGSDHNRLLEFFAGTPVVAIFAQILLLVGLVFYSQSRRFARAVPKPEPDRLSKLEYVGAMAELQNRVHAFDLAIENIYAEFRRRAARLVGLDISDAGSRRLAPLIAERTGLDGRRVYDILFKCEDIIRGEPTNRREVVRLADELRDLEQKLGIGRGTGKGDK